MTRTFFTVSVGNRAPASRRSGPRSALSVATNAGFTLVEVMVAGTLGAVVFAAALAAVVNLQKSYTATEQYATSLADQMRLVDYMSMDMRRARKVLFDADGNGMTLELPDYYRYNASDTQRTYPLPNTPTVPSDHSRAVYGNTTSPPRVYYRFTPSTGIITREEALANQALTNAAPGRQPVAANVATFPSIINDATDVPPTATDLMLKARITVSFHPMFQTPSTPDSNLITLHNVTFLRNNDSFH